MYTSILLPIDLGQDSSWKKALPIALDMAANHSAQLTIMTVLPDFGMSMVSLNFPADFEKNGLAKVSEALNSFVKEHVPGDVKVNTHVGHGTVYSEIIETADKLNCDLIVLTSHRPEMRDYLIGPNAARVVRHARQSVFVVRD